MLEVIAFDADDTLWHNETLYTMTQDRFKQLLSDYQSPEWIEERLYKTEMRNLTTYGYGIKGFTLSMIETAIELTEGRINGRQIQAIIDFAKEMLQAPVRLLDNVQPVLARLGKERHLMLITKGDLFDQESKIARSGLADYFTTVEIVSEKSEKVYRTLLSNHGIDPKQFLMVGNSLRSDILPVLALGGMAVHIPYHVTWAHEKITGQKEIQTGYFALEDIGQLPALVEEIDGSST